MKLSAAFALVFDLFLACRFAFFPTLKAVVASPLHFLRHPHLILRKFMAHVWAGGFADGTDENARDVKEGLITPHAEGVVLDLGAGK